MKKLLSVVMALVVVSISVVPAFGEEPRNAAVEAKRLTLEEKYGIDIRYELDDPDDPNSSASIGTGSLATLDAALERVTPQVVRQVSNYYQERNGKRLAYSFEYTPYYSATSNIEVLGMFEEKDSTIHIYLPFTSVGTTMSGDSPLTIVHEFGHAFHIMVMELMGEEVMEREWLTFNQGERYNTGYFSSTFNQSVFMSAYGATEYMEDFAEVFAHALVRNKPGQGIYNKLTGQNSSATALGDKVSYIARLFTQYVSDSEQVVENLMESYTTPIYLYYEGYQFSGDHLQFIGCAYPRYVLRGITAALGVSIHESHWISELGCWEVLSDGGYYYLIFPGGVWSELEGSIRYVNPPQPAAAA